MSGLVAAGHEVAILHPVRDGVQPRYTLERERAWTQAGTEVPVYLLHNAGDPKKRFRASYQDDVVGQRFDEVLDAEQPDVVHFTYLLWGLSVDLTEHAKARGIRTLVTLTDYGLLCHRGQMFDWCLKHCHGPHPAPVCARCIREPSGFDYPPEQVALRRVLVRTAAALGGLGRVVVAKDLEVRERVVRRALAAVDHFIAPTAVFERTFTAWGIPAEKITQLVYAFDTAPYEAARDVPELAAPGAPVCFGYMGQFTPHKGIETLIRAIRLMQARLPESVEPWRVHLFGRPAGGRHKHFAQRVFAGELGPRIVVEEPFEPHEAPEVLARLHAVVVPSEWDENAPLTILQARAAGVPVIGSDMAGIAEVVEAPRHGRIFPAGDSEALANVMRDVILTRTFRLPETREPIALEKHIEHVLGLYSG